MHFGGRLKPGPVLHKCTQEQSEGGGMRWHRVVQMREGSTNLYVQRSSPVLKQTRTYGDSDTYCFQTYDIRLLQLALSWDRRAALPESILHRGYFETIGWPQHSFKTGGAGQMISKGSTL